MSEQIKKIKNNSHPLLSKKVLITISLFICGYTLYLLHHHLLYVSTDDAFIEGHVVPISSKVSAHVLEVLVNDNQTVKAGDVLVKLDPRDFEVRYEIAKAQLQAAEAEMEQAVKDVNRYQQLIKTNDVSKQQLDQIELKLKNSQAQTSAAQARLKQAELDLSYTSILAPMSGEIAKKSVETGAFVQTGQPLMALVGEKKWVIANFKETQISKMLPGQEVKIKIDTYRRKIFEGAVDSIQRGTGSHFSLLPPENATGNFVKVVQRVPVKIIFDEEPSTEYPLAVGMSVVPDVKVGK